MRSRYAADVAGIGDAHGCLPVDDDLGGFGTVSDDHVEFVGGPHRTGALEPCRGLIGAVDPCVAGAFGMYLEPRALALQRLLLAVEQFGRVSRELESLDQVEPSGSTARSVQCRVHGVVPTSLGMVSPVGTEP